MLQQRAGAGQSAGGARFPGRGSQGGPDLRRPVLDIGDATVTIEMTGQTDEMDRFVEHMESFGIREMARTGVTALERGDRTIHDEE